MKAATKETNVTQDPYQFDVRSFLITAAIGAATGLVGWLLYLGVANYFIEPIFCKDASTYGVCRNGGTIAWIASHVVVVAAAVAAMARFAVYRPLLVAIGVIAALWGAHAWLGTMAWYMGGLWQTLLFALAFALFAWIARAKNFLVALIVTLAVVVAARVILLYA